MGQTEDASRRSASRRVSVALFATLLVAYGWFHQGGGWNQNVRFDQARAIAREGELRIDRTWLYEARREGNAVLFVNTPLAPDADPWREGRANSGDVSVHGGHVYPNKPPGTALLAVPAVWLLELGRGGPGAESAWSLTLGHYVATVLSVGIAGALAGVALFAASLRLAPALPLVLHAGAALLFGLATLMFPYATLLFDHVPVAAAAIVGFAALLRAAGAPGRDVPALLVAGFAAGALPLLNYVAGMLTVVLFGYAVWRLRRPGPLLLGSLAALPPVAALGIYHAVCFGSPFALVTQFENPMFASEEALFLGAFGLPDPVVMGRLLVSEYRGLFVASPILLMAVPGLWLLAWRHGRPVEASLAASVAVLFWLVNGSFLAWHGGAVFGPRYLIPALPFLCLGLAPALAWRPRLGIALGALSFAISLLVTAANPQVPLREESPLREHLLPIAAGRGVGMAAAFLAPLSSNPQGTYEFHAYSQFDRETPEAAWNSFNLGELVFPRSWLSVVPLLGLLAVGAGCTFYAARAPRIGRVTGE